MSTIKLTVKQINTVPYTAYEQLFDESQMQLTRASGQDTIFTYLNREYVVDETFAQVQALVDLQTSTSGNSKEIWGEFDATGGKAIGTHNFLDPITGVAITLPPNAYVTDGFYVVNTTFTSAGADAGTIALGIATDAAAGLKAAVAISDGTNPYDAGKFAIIPVGTVATFAAITTAERNVIAVVATQNLTAGVMKICLKYSVLPA
jgi:hypothetical protein